MNLSILLSILLTYPVYGSLLGQWLEGKDSRKLSLDFFVPGGLRSRRRALNMTCEEKYDSLYWEHWYANDEENCTTYPNGAKNCTYDFSTLVSNGGFNKAQDTCKGYGGDLYIYDAVITCEDGSSYTYVNDTLSCFTDCNERAAANVTQFDWEADAFVGGGAEKCTWNALTAYIMEDDGIDEDDDESALECEEFYDDTYWDHWDKYYNEDNNCTIDSGGAKSCTYDFSAVASNGAFDDAQATCKGFGGDLYTFDAVITCRDGSSYTFVNDVLSCISDCNEREAEFTTELVWEADEFLIGENKVNCTWDALTAYIMKDDEGVSDRPSTSPTVPSPTDTPTRYRRTLKPTMHPTPKSSSSSISMEPSSSPASGSGSSCIDSPLMFLVYDIPRCCEWISENPEERCNEMWGRGAGLTLNIRSHCPKSCGTCETYGCSDTDGEFILDGAKHRECCWLDSLGESQKEEMCAESRIHSTCQDTCGFCSE